jgi:hypothetical protein
MDGDAIAELPRARRYSVVNAVTGWLVSRALIPATSRGISTRKISGSSRATVEDIRLRGRLHLEKARRFFRDARSVGVAERTSA